MLPAALIGIHLQVATIVSPFRAGQVCVVRDDCSGEDVGDKHASKGSFKD
jgi:hypothetical protein